jgi:hypothetical protein
MQLQVVAGGRGEGTISGAASGVSDIPRDFMKVSVAAFVAVPGIKKRRPEGRHLLMAMRPPLGGV